MDIQKTIHQLFEKQAELRPNHTAVVFGKQSLTYFQLNNKANQLAHYLLAMNIQADTPVAFCLERSLDCLITILAILKAGAGYLPLDSTHPAERLQFILEDSASSMLITKSDFKSKFTHYKNELIVLDELTPQINKHPLHNPELDVSTEQLAYVIYTSGSTGTPKGVLIKHQSVINYCHWFSDYSSVNPKQRIDFSSNHTFDMAITISIAPLMLGMTIVICDDEVKKNTQNYLKYLKNSKVNYVKMTPSFFKVLIQEIRTKFIALPSLKAIILGGENLSTADCKAWLKFYPNQVLFNEYGPTETTVGVTQFKVSGENIESLEANVPIGTAGFNINCFILDVHGKEMPEEEIGELYIGGACLARGYLNRAELTEKQFINNPFNTDPQTRLYKTGDLCKRRADGIIEYFGRIDSQVKIRGFRIEPGEIERHLITQPDIDSAVVLAQKDLLNEDRLVAYYVLKNTRSAPTVGDLRQHLLNYLPEYMIPTAFIAIDAFPLTANGKLDVTLLPGPQLSASQAHREPVTDLEKTIASIWSEELSVKAIGLDDDFFELGGHSLSAARIISKINRNLKKDLTLHDFYYATNIAELANLLSKKKKAKKKNPAKSMGLSKTDTIPLSDFQFMLWMSNTFESKAKKLNITARKRFQGQLNKSALEFAFNAMLKKQEVLFYQVLKFKPAQLLQSNLPFTIQDINLQLLSDTEAEHKLQESINELENFYPWPKKSALIIARLFHLKHDLVELQISIPHIVSDDYSPEILLADLSESYLIYNKENHPDVLAPTKTYKEYVLNEQHYVHSHLNKDLGFWQNYLKDAGLFIFSKTHIIKNMSTAQKPYSTYKTMSVEELGHLKQFCARNHISINDGLCAALALALRNCAGNQDKASPYVYMNIVKSTRNNEAYDDIIGCFLRLEPIKIALDEKATLDSISKQIHQSTIDTSPYQQCPDLIKLTSIGTFHQKKNIFKSFLINTFASIYATLFSISEVNQKVFKLCAEHLSSFQRSTSFLININVHRDFIAETPKYESQLFGLNSKKVNYAQNDLLKIDNVLDVCFLRQENDNAPCLVISANLKPEFRELIAKETIRIIGSALGKSSQIPHLVYEEGGM